MGLGVRVALTAIHPLRLPGLDMGNSFREAPIRLRLGSIALVAETSIPIVLRRCISVRSVWRLPYTLPHTMTPRSIELTRDIDDRRCPWTIPSRSKATSSSYKESCRWTGTNRSEEHTIPPCTPPAPSPAMARPMTKATEFGAAPQMAEPHPDLRKLLGLSNEELVDELLSRGGVTIRSWLNAEWRSQKELLRGELAASPYKKHLTSDL